MRQSLKEVTLSVASVSKQELEKDYKRVAEIVESHQKEGFALVSCTAVTGKLILGFVTPVSGSPGRIPTAQCLSNHLPTDREPTLEEVAEAIRLCSK